MEEWVLGLSVDFSGPQAHLFCYMWVFRALTHSQDKDRGLGELTSGQISRQDVKSRASITGMCGPY